VERKWESEKARVLRTLFEFDDCLVAGRWTENQVITGSGFHIAFTDALATSRFSAVPFPNYSIFIQLEISNGLGMRLGLYSRMYHKSRGVSVSVCTRPLIIAVIAPFVAYSCSRTVKKGSGFIAGTTISASAALGCGR